MKEELYYLKSTKRGYLKGFQGNKPIWTEIKDEAVTYNEMEALKIQRRLENLSIVVDNVKLIEKEQII